MKSKAIEKRRRDKRGREIRHLVPEMLRFVDGHHVPAVQPAPERPAYRYSLPLIPGVNRDAIADMKAFTQEARQDAAMYESSSMEKTYHAWEKENAEYRSFSSEVMRMVKERYRKVSDFYHAAGIDKRTFHKIRSDYGYRPSRETAFRCCIGLKLNVVEAEELLRLAGMAFSPSDPDDLVLKFCLEKGINDIPGINYMLYRYANRSWDESLELNQAEKAPQESGRR